VEREALAGVALGQPERRMHLPAGDVMEPEIDDLDRQRLVAP
jgi:hypothetical protein